MATAVELIPSLIHFIKHNIMIITLTIILIDFLVLIANDIPYLPPHCLYLAYLTVVLRYRKQPSSYVLSAEQSKEILEKKNNSHKKDSKCIKNKTPMKMKVKKRTMRKDQGKKSRMKMTMIVIFEDQSPHMQKVLT
jgi:hypothetical protein